MTDTLLTDIVAWARVHPKAARSLVEGRGSVYEKHTLPHEREWDAEEMKMMAVQEAS